MSSSSRNNSRTSRDSKSTRNDDVFFTVPRPTRLDFDRNTEPGTYCDAANIREALTESIRSSGKSRSQIADEMTLLTGRKISERMLNGYTAASSEDYLFPAELARAFCFATGGTRLLDCMAELQGLRIIREEEAELIELGRAFLRRNRAEETIAMLQKRLQGACND